MKITFRVFVSACAALSMLLALPASACRLAPEKYIFPADPTRPFFPPASEISCKRLKNGMVVNLPLREVNGVLVYAIGVAPLTQLNAYLHSRGSTEKAKANADNPALGTVRIAYYDMPTSAGHFHSLAATIVTESGALPAAFHYALYFAHEGYNQQYGKYHIGIDKIQTPIRSNLRAALGAGPSAAKKVRVLVGDARPNMFIFNLDVTIPANIGYSYVPSLRYKTSSEGAEGGVGPQVVTGLIRGNFSAPIGRDKTPYSLKVGGKLKDFLTQVGYQLTGFQVVKDFDLVEW